jgi:ribosomal protein S18 acetylase RimI-like enzyme
MSQVFAAISGAFGKNSTNHLLAVIDKTDQQSGDRYREHGYVEIHDVLHLVCVQQQSRPTESSLVVESPARLLLTPVVESSFAEFLSLVEATFQHSDDCPGLNEQATLDEVQSRWSRTPAERRAQSWYRASIAIHGQPVDVGCLVLDVEPGSRSAELIYLGLIPEHRGKGLGNELVSRAQGIICQAGKDTTIVSVDASNQKALRGYVAHGFTPYAESTVFAKTLE